MTESGSKAPDASGVTEKVSGGGSTDSARGGASDTKNKSSSEELLPDDTEFLMKQRRLKHDWCQTNEVVTITLPVGAKLERNDINVVFSQTDVKVTLKDGRTWDCAFAHDISQTDCRVLIKKQNIKLRVRKVEAIQWASLESEAEDIDVVGDVASEMLATSSEDAVFEITHAKHDYYEKPPNEVTVILYIKQINNDTVDISFHEYSIIIKFQSSDPTFLNIYSDCDCKTMFCWKLNLRNAIVADQCRYRVTSKVIDMTLRKRDLKKWTSLEAPSIPAPLAVPTDTWLNLAPKAEATSSKLSEAKQFTPTGTKETSISKSSSAIPLGPPPDKVAESMGQRSKSTEQIFTEKPTCMVSPLTKLSNSKPTGSELCTDRGMTGLDNLGNTCFMNSVLQVLANTRELRDYFNESRFQSEINTDNPLGSGGKLVLAFAVLLKVLWSGKHYSYAPSKLKNLIAMKATQFTGFAQHDAQEFMAYLLDGLHEDINRVRKKPYTDTVDSDGRLDWIVAQESWDVYRQRNDSFIVDLFQGQYKSKLTCPACNKVSITFDPFLYLSVPLPKKQRYFSVVFLYKESYKRPVRYHVRLPVDATVDLLKEALQVRTNVRTSDLRVFQTYRHKIHKYFDKSNSLHRVSGDDVIFASEVLSEQLAGERVYELPVMQRTHLPHQISTKCSYCKRECLTGAKLKRCTVCYKVAYCDQTCQRSHWATHRLNCKLTPEPVGTPFIVSLPESQATFSRLCQVMEEYARYSVDVFRPPEAPDRKIPTSPSCSQGVASTSFDQSETPEDSLDQSDSSSSSTLCDMDEIEETETSFIDASSFLPDDEKDRSSPASTFASKTPPVTMVLGMPQKSERGAPLFDIKPVNEDGQNLPGSHGEQLQDLGDRPLDLSGYRMLSIDWKNHDRLKPYALVQSKELDCEDVCTAEGTEDGNVTIQQCLDLFTEPEVLNPEEAWYCPKCKEHRCATKQMSIWKLPHSLIIQLKRFSFRNFIWRDKIDKMIEFPIRGLDLTPYCMGAQASGEPAALYDLYGVINHHGGILGGHYTSYARCPDLNQEDKDEVSWRLFDDHRVTMCSERSVATPAAYLLFYRRREYPMFVSRPLHQSYNAADKAYVTSQDEAYETFDARTLADDLAVEAEEILEDSVESGIARDDSCSSDEDTQNHSFSSGFVSGSGDALSQGVCSLSESLGYTDMDSID